MISAKGAVNAHTHLYSGLAPLGMPTPKPAPEGFLEILARVWWRLDRALDEATLRAAARFYAASALGFGTTLVVDHHESPSFLEGSLDVIADACEELGIRALVAYGATERNGGRGEARRGLAECKRFCEENRRPLVRGAIGIHASFTVSDETLREAGQMARDLGVVVHVHVAEDAADVEDARARGYEGPLERMLTLDALPPGSILAHGVHLTPDAARKADDRGLWIVQNPRSNENNRVGYPSSLALCSRVALGTDGFPSNMNDERDALARVAAQHGEIEGVAGERLSAGRALLAEIFGEDADDSVTLDDDGKNVRDVIVGGRQVVRDGGLVSADRAAIEREARAAAGALFRRMEAL